MMAWNGETLIRKKSVEICSDMNAKMVALYLFAQGVLDLDDKESVGVESTTRAQNEKLLGFIHRRGPKAYQHFHQALKETTPHLADLLDAQELSDSVFAEQLRVGVPCKVDLVGRRELCQRLIHTVQEGNTQRLTVLTAPPGHGKSAVATSMSHELMDMGVDVIYATLRQASSFAAVASHILQSLGIAVGTKPNRQAEEFFKQRECKTMLVLDNAEDLLEEQHKKHFLEFLQNVTCYASKVHTLVTSRKTVEGLKVAQDTSRVAQIPLEALDEEQSKEFLMKMLESPSLRENQVKDLGRLCGGVPLFLQLAASIINGTEDVTLLIHELQSRPELVLITNDPGFKDYYSELQFFIGHLSAELQDALNCLAVFPVSFSDDEARVLFPEELREWDYQSILKRLRSHALLHRDVDTTKLSLHPLVQAFCKASSDTAASCKYSLAMKQFIYKYLRMLRDHNTRFISTDCKHAIDEYDLNKGNIKHALKSAAADVQMKVYGIKLSIEVVNFLAKVLNIDEFLWLYEGFQNAASTMRDNTELVAACLTSIGFKQLCYHGKELSKEAKNTLTEAMRVWVKAGLPQREEAAHCLSKLGLCLVRNGETEEGVHKIAQAIIIRKKLIHAGGSITERMLLGGSYCDLGMALYEMKQYRAAINIWTNLTLVRYKELLQKHPFTASLLDYIGDAYGKLHQFPQAVEFKHQSLVMRKGLLTEYHPDTARAFYGLGCMLAEQGCDRWQEAMEMLKKAKHIQVRVHASHCDVEKTQHKIQELTDVSEMNNWLQNCHINGSNAAI